MSNLDNLIRKIMDDASAKAEKILKEADGIREKIINEKSNKAEEERGKIIEKAKNEAFSMKNQIISNAKLKARDSILAAKQRLIDEVFSKAKEQLMNISNEQYAEFFKNNISTIKLKGNEIFVVPENRKEIVKSLEPGIAVSDEETINSGFVIVDGNIRINYTLMLC